MLRYLFDTDHLTFFQHGHALVVQRLGLQPLGSVGISVVTIEESLRGRLAQLARAGDGPTRIRQYTRLARTIRLLTQFSVVPYDLAADASYQHLRPLRSGILASGTKRA
jgi:tRNA(fMet)-specific endonuclease VapC